jgi:spore coat protein Y
MCPDNNTNTQECCIANIIEVIIKLQNRSDKFDCLGDGCDRPFLGPIPTTTCYNTRPVNLYRCSDGETWTLPYSLNGTTGTSNVLRCEQIDGCCVTCRILAPNPDTTAAQTNPYVATESHVTINLNCIGAIQCLPDTYIACS